MIDTIRVKVSFSKSVESYHSNSYVQKQICYELMEILNSNVDGQIDRVLEIGCGSGNLTKLILQRYPNCSGVINDLCDRWKSRIAPLVDERNFSLIWGDAEAISFDGEYDLIASSSAIQWLKNPDLFLANCYNKLRSGGYMLISTFGIDNLKEIRELTGIGLEYYSLDRLCSLIPQDALLLEAFQTETVLEFDSPVDVLKHLKQTGVNCVSSEIWTKQRLQKFVEGYRSFSTKCDSDKVKYNLTYNPVYFLIKKP